MTLVFQKVQREWKIIHDHTSTQTEQPNATVSAAPNPAAPPNQPQAEPASAATTRIPVADGQAVIVKAQSFVHYDFQLPAATCSISGRIVGVSGGNKDFEAFIMDDDNFVNFSAGVSGARVNWQSGRVVVAPIDVSIAGPGVYHLVVSNSWSLATDKTVQAQAVAQCRG